MESISIYMHVYVYVYIYILKVTLLPINLFTLHYSTLILNISDILMNLPLLYKNTTQLHSDTIMFLSKKKKENTELKHTVQFENKGILQTDEYKSELLLVACIPLGYAFASKQAY